MVKKFIIHTIRRENLFRSLVFQRVLDDGTDLGWGFEYCKECALFSTEEPIDTNDADGFYKAKDIALNRSVKFLTDQGYDKDDDVNYLFG